MKALDDSVGVHKLLFLASPEDEEVSDLKSVTVLTVRNLPSLKLTVFRPEHGCLEDESFP